MINDGFYKVCSIKNVISYDILPTTALRILGNDRSMILSASVFVITSWKITISCGKAWAISIYNKT